MNLARPAVGAHANRAAAGGMALGHSPGNGRSGGGGMCYLCGGAISLRSEAACVPAWIGGGWLIRPVGRWLIWPVGRRLIRSVDSWLIGPISRLRRRRPVSRL
jgi:hypothetical protein